MNDGVSAENAWVHAKTKAGAIVERFWDAKALRGLNNLKSVKDFPKPADYLVTEAAGIHYAEIKSVQSATSFGFNNLRPKQVSTALAHHSRGWGDRYVFYIFSFGLGKWFTMNADQFATIRALKSSAKFSELTPWNIQT